MFFFLQYKNCFTSSLLMQTEMRFYKILSYNAMYIIQLHYICTHAMSKLIKKKEWKAFFWRKWFEIAELNCIIKPKVNCIQPQGDRRSEQSALAKHMAHDIKTADKYYDKSMMSEQRHTVLDRIHIYYKARNNRYFKIEMS